MLITCRLFLSTHLLALGGLEDGGNENVLSMCSVAYGGESVMSYDLEQFYRNLSTGGGTYKIKTGRNKYEEKVIDPRCLVCWYRGGMTSNTIAAGEESLREDFKGCKRGSASSRHIYGHIDVQYHTNSTQTSITSAQS